MPPKRSKKAKNIQADFEGEEEGGERGGEISVDSSFAAAQQPVRKRATAAKQKHDAVVLAIDVGATSMNKSVLSGDETDIQRSVLLADWIISRKLFTDSNDQFVLIFFGHESSTEDKYPNVYVHNVEFQRARVEWLHVLKNEVQPNPKRSGDYLTALFSALELLKVHAESEGSAFLTEATVTLISNFSGLGADDQVFEMMDPVVDAVKAIGARLFIIGPDLEAETPPFSKNAQLGHEFIRQLLGKVDGVSFNFTESLRKLQFFIPKSVVPRGQPFNLELGKDFSVRVQLYVKNQEVLLQERFDPVTAATSSFSKPSSAAAPFSASTSSADKQQQQIQTQLKKVRRYEMVNDQEQGISLSAIDSTPDITFTSTSTVSRQLMEAAGSGKIVHKENIVRGYRYGSTIVTFDNAIQMLADIPHEGKQLKLIQFARRENILLQFLVSSPRYILPHRDSKSGDDQRSFNILSALVRAMQEMNVVALCRYAYNAASNPRLACLIPKITKKENYPILIHYLMPFRDDFRYFDFPPILTTEVSEYQSDLIDEYINNLMLSTEEGENELLKKRSVHDPRIQFQCMTLREKALNPGKQQAELTAEDKQALLELLSPPRDLLANAKNVIETMKGEFILQEKSSRTAAFRRDDGIATTETPRIGEQNDVAALSMEEKLEPILRTFREESKKLADEERGGSLKEFGASSNY